MSNSGKKPTDDDEVEQLLRAAQDDVLLKLSVHSHMARGSASAAIDPDLDRRFQALRKPQKPAKIGNSAKKAPPETDHVDNKAPTEDDLYARFAALRKSLPSYSGNEDKSEESVSQLTEEDEVEKVMNWAIDAARLDPSPPSDDDDDDDDDDDSDNDYDDGSDDGRGKKGKRK